MRVAGFSSETMLPFYDLSSGCRVRNALHLNISNKSSECRGTIETGKSRLNVVGNESFLIGFN